eukprot:6816761-Lingulodinium_polyedra.AAC.1
MASPVPHSDSLLLHRDPMGKDILYNKATFENIILLVGHWAFTFTKQGWGKVIGSSSTMVCSKELTG